MRQHAAREGEQGRAGWQTQTNSVGVHQGQRAPQQCRTRIDTDSTHQVQRFAVGPDQDVLAVVQQRLTDIDAARASTERR
jgi:hypothetical protein